MSWIAFWLLRAIERIRRASSTPIELTVHSRKAMSVEVTQDVISVRYVHDIQRKMRRRA